MGLVGTLQQLSPRTAAYHHTLPSAVGVLSSMTPVPTTWTQTYPQWTPPPAPHTRNKQKTEWGYSPEPGTSPPPNLRTRAAAGPASSRPAPPADAAEGAALTRRPELSRAFFTLP